MRLPFPDEEAWLAGLLEGEGSFFADTERGRVVPRITVSMSDRDVIERVAAMWDVEVYTVVKGPNHLGKKTMYAAVLRGKAAVRLMERLIPHMGKRRHNKIGEILDLYRNRRLYPKGCRKHGLEHMDKGKRPRCKICGKEKRKRWEKKKKG